MLAVVVPLSAAGMYAWLGAPLAVTEIATTFELPFAAPTTITSSGYRQILLDIDEVSADFRFEAARRRVAAAVRTRTRARSTEIGRAHV